MNSFLVPLIASAVVATAWTILAGVGGHRTGWRMLGAVGTWIATLVLAAFWQAKALPWLLDFLQGILLVWLGALGLVVAGTVSIWPVRGGGGWALVGCAVASLGVHAAAGLWFFWLAVVSPGGV